MTARVTMYFLGGTISMSSADGHSVRPTLSGDDLLAAVPSIIYGLWGVLVLAPFLTPLAEFLNRNLGWIFLFGDGNIMLIGNGDSASVHDARFDFNDEAIPFGVAYFRALVERRMPL